MADTNKEQLDRIEKFVRERAEVEDVASAEQKSMLHDLGERYKQMREDLERERKQAFNRFLFGKAMEAVSTAIVAGVVAALKGNPTTSKMMDDCIAWGVGLLGFLGSPDAAQVFVIAICLLVPIVLLAIFLDLLVRTVVRSLRRKPAASVSESEPPDFSNTQPEAETRATAGGFQRKRPTPTENRNASAAYLRSLGLDDIADRYGKN